MYLCKIVKSLLHSCVTAIGITTLLNLLNLSYSVYSFFLCSYILYMYIYIRFLSLTKL